ncbi:MAG: L-seryl-tRNA(Sec) selenium transferase [Chloroflexi bacterium]|nr:L-seryl-tRNA(Sec) selenium transferase [Chloroflexota bacterium]
MSTNLRSLPSVERLLSATRVRELAEAHSHDAVTGVVRRVLESAREKVKAGEAPPTIDALIDAIVERASRTLAHWPRRVTNATGVVLHTNLGRAPLSKAAVEAAMAVAGGYTDLEMDLATGRRGSRMAHISELLSQTTGAEAGLVVNNNAAALLLGLTAYAQGREVIVSRGEAVEIGGGFRIPDVLQQSGATLVEVGTTNRTYVGDYETAITERTSVLLKVHQSNFAIRGFTHTADLEALARLAKDRGLVVFHDLGSGALLDTTAYGLPKEPMVQESVSQGADLAFFSGDKLLGGPQAGIAVGRRAHVDTLARHPLARAVRVEKVTLAALSATLLSYVRGTATSELPVWRMISMPAAEVRKRAERWKSDLGLAHAEVRESKSTIGGGSLPDETLPTYVLAVRPEVPPERFIARLRSADPPVIARIEADEILFDPRTVLVEEDPLLIEAVRAALTG